MRRQLKLTLSPALQDPQRQRFSTILAPEYEMPSSRA